MWGGRAVLHEVRPYSGWGLREISISTSLPHRMRVPTSVEETAKRMAALVYFLKLRRAVVETIEALAVAVQIPGRGDFNAFYNFIMSSSDNPVAFMMSEMLKPIDLRFLAVNIMPSARPSARTSARPLARPSILAV